MTIRSKLNLAVITLLLIFLGAAAFTMRAVRENTAFTHSYRRMRALGDLTAGIHTGIYRELALSRGVVHLPAGPPVQGWLHYALRDIDMQIGLAQDREEEALWRGMRRAVAALCDSDPTAPGSLSTDQAVALAEQKLRALRNRYQLAEYESIAETEKKSLRAQQALWIAGTLMLLLFLMYGLMVRRWLVRPIELLKSTADAIGAGTFKGSVPLSGHDELSELARRLEAMDARLTAHQAALMKARELSAIGELCTNVAHGLRNPLAAMRACVRQAGGHEATAEQLAAVVGDLVHQVNRMDERITKLFEFSRPRELHPDWATFHQVALTAQAHLLSLLNERGVRLVIDDRSGDTRWYLDRDELADALAELITNAVRASASGSDVILRGEPSTPAKPSGRHLRIQVIDRGTGMVPAEVRKAFDLFFTSRKDGTGMGLAMVRRTVERLGGEVTLTSDVARGTTVTLTLPECGVGGDVSAPAPAC